MQKTYKINKYIFYENNHPLQHENKTKCGVADDNAGRRSSQIKTAPATPRTTPTYLFLFLHNSFVGRLITFNIIDLIIDIKEKYYRRE